jgi:hypothetical protein
VLDLWGVGRSGLRVSDSLVGIDRKLLNKTLIPIHTQAGRTVSTLDLPPHGEAGLVKEDHSWESISCFRLLIWLLL